MKKVDETTARYFTEFWEGREPIPKLKSRILTLIYESKNLSRTGEDWKWIYFNLGQWWGSNSNITDEQIEYAIDNYYTGKIYDRSTPVNSAPDPDIEKPKKSNNQLFLIF